IGTGHSFAFVPPSGYHVTVVNRTYFDDGEVFEMSPEENDAAARVITNARVGPVTIDFMGFLVSADGRLLVQGFPSDDALRRLRMALAQEVPVLSRRVPQLAHLKLGHFMVWQPREQLREILSWLATCSFHVNARVRFVDVYTPRTRVAL